MQTQERPGAALVVATLKGIADELVTMGFDDATERSVRAWRALPDDPLPGAEVLGKVRVKRETLRAWADRHLKRVP